MRMLPALPSSLFAAQSEVNMDTQHAPRLGDCPHCDTGIRPLNVLIEYETDDGNEAIWAECPGCKEIVDPI